MTAVQTCAMDPNLCDAALRIATRTVLAEVRWDMDAGTSGEDAFAGFNTRVSSLKLEIATQKNELYLKELRSSRECLTALLVCDLETSGWARGENVPNPLDSLDTFEERCVKMALGKVFKKLTIDD